MERLEHPELLRDHERLVVREHHAARADADRRGRAREVRDQHGGRGAGDARHVVVLRDPVAQVAEPLHVAGEVDRVPERLPTEVPVGTGARSRTETLAGPAFTMSPVSLADCRTRVAVTATSTGARAALGCVNRGVVWTDDPSPAAGSGYSRLRDGVASLHGHGRGDRRHPGLCDARGRRLRAPRARRRRPRARARGACRPGGGRPGAVRRPRRARSRPSSEPTASTGSWACAPGELFGEVPIVARHRVPRRLPRRAALTRAPDRARRLPHGRRGSAGGRAASSASWRPTG